MVSEMEITGGNKLIGAMSLNPCFGGIWSLRAIYVDPNNGKPLVLILVLVGYGL